MWGRSKQGRMKINGEGNVGIGTMHPVTTLDVNGTMRLAVNFFEPYPCDPGHSGAIALTSLFTTCVCTGTDWVSAYDGTSGCDWESIPLPTCDSTHLELCTTGSDCTGAEGYWWNNNTCNITPGPTCDSSNLPLCTSSGECTSAGGYWWNSQCHSTPASAPEGTVISATGRVWMDRNLGASQAAIQDSDPLAFGDLYQWGRGSDGHEKRTSQTTTINQQSSTDYPGHGNFVATDPNTSVDDWRVPQNNNLWQGVTGINNPCPAGFRLPTETEFVTELATWSSDNIEGAFSSPLKLVSAGYRSGDIIFDYNVSGYFTSTTEYIQTHDEEGSVAIMFFRSYDPYQNEYSSHILVGPTHRAMGLSVRCIQD